MPGSCLFWNYWDVILVNLIVTKLITTTLKGFQILKNQISEYVYNALYNSLVVGKLRGELGGAIAVVTGRAGTIDVCHHYWKRHE